MTLVFLGKNVSIALRGETSLYDSGENMQRRINLARKMVFKEKVIGIRKMFRK